MKYTCQRSGTYDCAPVAIYNALKYFGVSSNVSKLRRYCRKNALFPYGTSWENLKYIVESKFQCEILLPSIFGFNYRYKILSHLQKKPALYQIPSKSGYGHMFFIERYLPKQNKIIVANIAPNIRKQKIIVGKMRNCQVCILLHGVKNYE